MTVVLANDEWAMVKDWKNNAISVYRDYRKQYKAIMYSRKCGEYLQTKSNYTRRYTTVEDGLVWYIIWNTGSIWKNEELPLCIDFSAMTSPFTPSIHIRKVSVVTWHLTGNANSGLFLWLQFQVMYDRKVTRNTVRKAKGLNINTWMMWQNPIRAGPPFTNMV